MPLSNRPAQPIARHAEARVREALEDTCIVALVGPRQSGRTTLVRKIAADREMCFVTLDDGQSRAFAPDDPGGFLRGLDRAVIDEIQRAGPDPRAHDGRRGRSSGKVPDHGLRRRARGRDLARFPRRARRDGRAPAFQPGRVEQHGPSDFLARAFAGDFPARIAWTGYTPALIQRVVSGGYPEALARTDPARRQVWLTLLERMFLLRRVRAWHRNDRKRLIQTPKLRFLDSGLVAALRRLGEEDLRRDRAKLGGLLEGFVFSEPSKLVGQEDEPIAIDHLRDRDTVEVDFVLERAGRVVGIEVKAAASVKPADFHALKRLGDGIGDAFACGIVLHDGERIGERLFAMPIDRL